MQVRRFVARVPIAISPSEHRPQFAIWSSPNDIVYCIFRYLTYIGWSGFESRLASPPPFLLPDQEFLGLWDKGICTDFGLDIRDPWDHTSSPESMPIL